MTKKTFKCAACGKRENADQMHVITVNQKNSPVDRPEVRFTSIGHVQICQLCFERYGRR